MIKNAIQKITIFVILIIFIFPLICGLHVQATGDGTVSSPWDISENGDRRVTAYISNNQLCISGRGAMKDFNSYQDAPWYSSRSDIEQIYIENGITRIGDYAFYQCYLGNRIPNSVTSIGKATFANCKSTSITIPDSVTEIGEGAFLISECTTINLPNDLKTIPPRLFYGCYQLTSLTIPNSVTTIASTAFVSCPNLTSINVNSNNTSYSSIDGILFNKNKTTLVKYPSMKSDLQYVIPNSVTTIGPNSFDWCINLTSITIPNSVTTIDPNSFQYCTNLTSINVSTDNTSYSSIDGILFNKNRTTLVRYPCIKSDLQYVIPNSVTTIEDYAFERLY